MAETIDGNCLDQATKGLLQGQRLFRLQSQPLRESHRAVGW